MQFKSLFFLVLMVLAFAAARKLRNKECKLFCETYPTLYETGEECKEECRTFDTSMFGVEDNYEIVEFQ
ncbi:unnamed protein product [Cylicocyclus nassatus]|uniref:Uncharacterized protein n=1 Tax=Cylicocyclus nassatus TaxID=53992 RepID=A0AA36GVZ7_CYLNA|nr:unnamed protein product [Cylicocyclus nassatus]